MWEQAHNSVCHPTSPMKGDYRERQPYPEVHCVGRRDLRRRQ